jgi:predicted deacetylase
MSSLAATQFLPVVATASGAKDFIVVSVHDVAPFSQRVSDKIIAALAGRGIRVCSLLVVSDYHHQGAMMKDRQFVSWLRDLESEGHEIVIHGYFHQRPRRSKETLRDRFLTRFYTNDEGEFYDLSYAEAFRRIAAARDEFRALGLMPRGFVAPAWLLNTEGERAARDAGMEYTTRLRTVRDLHSGEDFPARSVVYSVRSNWRRQVSLVWNAALVQFSKNDPLLRLSVHPPDYTYPAIWRQIVDLISSMDGERTATTYRDWIAEQRSTGGAKL